MTVSHIVPAAPKTGPVAMKGTTSTLSTLKSIEDLDTFIDATSAKELNTKFLGMLKEFQDGSSKSNGSSSMNKTQRGFSLSQILAQSLQNGDKQMLEAALCVSSAQHAKVLQISLMRLPAGMILPLLEAISKRITLKPRRAIHLLPWLKNLLLCHAGYLSTVPSAAKLLAPLQQSIEERMATLNPMQKLAGRLELILKQSSLREMSRLNAENGVEEMSEEPLTVYDESETEPETEIDEDDMMEMEEETDNEEFEEEDNSDNENDDDEKEQEEDDDDDDSDEDDYEDEDDE